MEYFIFLVLEDILPGSLLLEGSSHTTGGIICGFAYGRSPNKADFQEQNRKDVAETQGKIRVFAYKNAEKPYFAQTVRVSLSFSLFN